MNSTPKGVHEDTKPISPPCDYPTDIKFKVPEYEINSILVNIGSHINVMFYDCFLKLDLQEKDMFLVPLPIMGFTSHTTSKE